MSRINVVIHGVASIQRIQSIQRAFREIGIVYINQKYDYVDDKNILMFDDDRMLSEDPGEQPDISLTVEKENVDQSAD